MMKFNITVDCDQIDNITRDNLIEAFEISQESVASLKSRTELKPYQLEDLKYDKKLLKALKRVIKYYSNPGEYASFKERFDV